MTANPRQRPELAGSRPDPARRCQGCEDAPVGQHTGPHDWERPEERDSLSEIEHKYVDAVEKRPDLYHQEKDVLRLVADVRSLEAEVKELREKNALLHDLLEGQRESIDEHLTRIKQMEEALREIAESKTAKHEPPIDASEMRVIARKALG